MQTHARSSLSASSKAPYDLFNKQRHYQRRSQHGRGMWGSQTLTKASTAVALNDTYTPVVCALPLSNCKWAYRSCWSNLCAHVQLDVGSAHSWTLALTMSPGYAARPLTLNQDGNFDTLHIFLAPVYWHKSCQATHACASSCSLILKWLLLCEYIAIACAVRQSVGCVIMMRQMHWDKTVCA